MTDTADLDCAGADAADNSVDIDSVNLDRTDTDIVEMDSTVISSFDTNPPSSGSVDIDPNFPENELVAIAPASASRSRYALQGRSRRMIS